MNNMKNLKLVAIALFSLAIFSCSSDDDNVPTGPTVSSNLYATWNMLEYYEQDDIQNPVTEIPCNEDLQYTFNSNKTFTKTEFSGDDINNCQVSVTINGDWEIIDENTILLIPSSSSISEEEINFQLGNNGQELKIFRGSTVEEYRRP